MLYGLFVTWLMLTVVWEIVTFIWIMSEWEYEVERERMRMRLLVLMPFAWPYILFKYWKEFDATRNLYLVFTNKEIED